MRRMIAGLMAAGVMMASLTGCQATAGNSAVQTTAGSSAAQTTAAGQPESGIAAGSTAESENGGAAEGGSGAGDSRGALSGTITLYTSQPEEDAQKLIDGFNEKCPDIQVDVFRSGTEEVISKVLAEKQAESVLADVLLVADNVTFESLKEQNMLQPYQSPELQGIPADYIDKDHMYTGTKVITTGIVYNTELMDTPPQAFSDLAGESCRNQAIMPSPLYSGAAAYNLGVMTRTEGLGWEYFEGLKANGITVDKGNGAIQKAVVAGDKSCGILVDYMAVRSKNDGAPVEFVYPREGSPAVTEPIGIVNGTKHQELAQAFVDYVLSEDGQKLAAAIGYTPVKSGVQAPAGLNTIDQIQLMSQDTTTLYQQRDADKQAFSQLFQ